MIAGFAVIKLIIKFGIGNKHPQQGNNSSDKTQ